MAKGKYARWLKPESLTLLEGWARDGLTDEQIAQNVGIAVCTLYDWEARFPEISEALKKGKEVVDYEVENALYKRAVGYTYEEETKEMSRDPRTGEITRQTVRVTKKHVPPDVLAMIYWLKNRKPKDWRDKRYVYDELEKTDGPSPMEQLVRSLDKARAEKDEREVPETEKVRDGDGDK